MRSLDTDGTGRRRRYPNRTRVCASSRILAAASSTDDAAFVAHTRAPESCRTPLAAAIAPHQIVHDLSLLDGLRTLFERAPFRCEYALIFTLYAPDLGHKRRSSHPSLYARPYPGLSRGLQTVKSSHATVHFSAGEPNKPSRTLTSCHVALLASICPRRRMPRPHLAKAALLRRLQRVVRARKNGIGIRVPTGIVMHTPASTGSTPS